MRVAMLTREYPPEVYGGAGVHVEFLVRELRRLADVDVHCFGRPRAEDGVQAYPVPAGLASANPALQTLAVDLQIAAGVGGADVLHSHTWYANLAGVLGSQLHGVPHVLTAHSLEPQRPWKAEQLGGGYRISCWAERQAYECADAVIAVSDGMRTDVLDSYPFVDPARVHVIHNGIDTALYAPSEADDTLARYGIDRGRPYALFVGRITRQKGLAHLIAAAAAFDPAISVVLCAGAPDTAQIAAETEAAVATLAARRSGVIWIREMLPRPQIRQLLSSATVFVCPSVYEPQGIVNLEAMACQTAVVASAVGGIPEVVADGVTGVLVPAPLEVPSLAQTGGTPTLSRTPAQFEAGLAEAVNALCADPERAAAMGRAGRERAIEQFSWASIARRTVALYRSVLGR
jgi:alpha-maltose-1-phosphate synthase